MKKDLNEDKNIDRKYILQNKNTKVYLKLHKQINLKHYVVDIEEATKFTYREAYDIKKKYKHPENWSIRKRKG